MVGPEWVDQNTINRASGSTRMDGVSWSSIWKRALRVAMHRRRCRGRSWPPGCCRRGRPNRCRCDGGCLVVHGARVAEPAPRGPTGRQLALAQRRTRLSHWRTGSNQEAGRDQRGCRSQWKEPSGPELQSVPPLKGSSDAPETSCASGGCWGCSREGARAIEEYACGRFVGIDRHRRGSTAARFGRAARRVHRVPVKRGRVYPE